MSHAVAEQITVLTPEREFPQEARPWAVILAGGDGTRLRPLTRLLAGDERPKQFCKIIGAETLLQQTTRRVACLVARERTVVMVIKKHLQFFASDIAAAGGNVIAQPENRGTGAAILYSLFSIQERDPGAHVALFPSDHYFEDDKAFMKQVAQAFLAVRESSERAILLGIVPSGPDVDYGWIQPRFSGPKRAPLLDVERFWEKPALPMAETLFAYGCLWNSFILVSSVRALLRMMRSAVPAMYESFRAARESMRTSREADAMGALYARLPAVDFSHDVLVQCPEFLSVLPVTDTGWVDLGRPERVLEFRSGRNAPPSAA